jgi:hypothetical protein
VDVQVGALGKLVQEGAQGRWSCLYGGLIGAGGAGFRSESLGVEGGGCGGKGDTGGKASGEAHNASQCRAEMSARGGFLAGQL